MRLDKYLKVSRVIKRRTLANEVADAGRVLVNGKPAKSSYKVKPLDRISLVMPYPRREVEIIPENIPLDIVYEDDDPEKLAERLAWAIEHPEALAAMHDSCRRLYEQQFSNESYVATLTRLVKELTDGNE